MEQEKAISDKDRVKQIREERKDKDFQEKQQQFDAKYLTEDERDKIKELDETEKKQLNKSSWEGFRTATSTASATLGAGPISKAFGAAGMLDHSNKKADANEAAVAANDEKAQLRIKAQERFEKAQATSNIKEPQAETEEDYGYGKRY